MRKTDKADTSEPRSSEPGQARVAYLVSRYPAVSHTFILREVRALRELGIDVHVASVNEADRASQDMTCEERYEAEHTYVLKRHGAMGALQAAWYWGWAHPMRWMRTLGAAWAGARGLGRVRALAYALEAGMVARWMQDHKLEHLHVHFGNAAATVGVLVKHLHDVGLSLTIHGPDEFDDVKGQRLAWKMAWADRVICISAFARSQLMRVSAPTDWSKFLVCYLGVDRTRFAPPQAEHLHAPSVHPRLAHRLKPVEDKLLRVLCVGRLAPAKGQMVLLQACAQLMRSSAGIALEVVLVGQGPDALRLQQATQALGLQDVVQFKGALNEYGVRHELSHADVFVLPSLAEGIPVVLMEAMASGVPCISTRITGMAELIEHEHNGLLVHAGDANSLSQELQRLLYDPALRQHLRDNAHDRIAQQFDLQRNVAELAGIFRTMPRILPHEQASFPLAQQSPC